MEAEPATSNIVRQGTKRVSRLPRKPSKRVTAEQVEAARQASVAEDEPMDEIEEAATEVDVAPANIVAPTATLAEGGDVATAEASPEPAPSPQAAASPTDNRKSEVDPFSALWAGFSIPMKLSKFQMEVPGREVLEVGSFTLIQKKFMAKVGCPLSSSSSATHSFFRGICGFLQADALSFAPLRAFRSFIVGGLALGILLGLLSLPRLTQDGPARHPFRCSWCCAPMLRSSAKRWMTIVTS